MSSSVFYKFKNSKEPERIVFDGTDISVFELKREIINLAGLGNTDDYVLLISLDGEELKDDTTLVPRSSTVIATRRPCPKGKGNAARYLTGRAPTRAFAKKADPVAGSANGAATESDAEAAFFASEAQNWEQAKESLAKGEKVAFRSKKPVNVPDHPPPPGYICYRCNERGHWIQQCPTNDDPNYQAKPRAKRTTGIPKSRLQVISKDAVDEEDGSVFLDADGNFVRVLSDQKTWNDFQAKATASKTQAANADAANKELEERGLLCPFEKQTRPHVFDSPGVLPCCSAIGCISCLENALAENDLVCTLCSTPDVLIDDISKSDEMEEKVRAYEKEKAAKEEQAKAQVKAAETKPSVSSSNNESEVVDSAPSGSLSPKPSGSNAKSPLTAPANPNSNVATTTSVSTSTPTATASAAGNVSDSDTSTTSKKRKEAPTEIKAPTAPKAMRIQKEQQRQQGPSNNIEQDFLQQMEALKNMPNPNMGGGPNGMPMMGNMNMNMPMSMSNGMPMNPMLGMMNPMAAMNGFNPNMNMNMNGGGNWGNNGGNWNGFPQQQQQNQNFQNGNMYGYNGYQNGGNWNGGGYNNNGGGMNGMGGFQQMGMGGMNGGGFNGQINQQDAYDRKPVNPHRNQKRKQRAPDYRYV